MLISDFLKRRQEIPKWKYKNKENKSLSASALFTLLFFKQSYVEKTEDSPKRIVFNFLLTRSWKKTNSEKTFIFPAAVKI